MTAATLLFLPPDADRPWRWWRVRDDGLAAEGEGVPPAADPPEPVIAIAPADAVTLHWAELPARTPQQAVAAARVLVSDATAIPGDLHVAVGPAGTGERAVAVVAPERMADWLARCTAFGIDPDAILPLPLLVPEPEEGFVRADIAGQSVIRGRATGFADESPITELVTAGEAPSMLSRDAVAAAASAAVSVIPLDLRQGAFARRRKRSIDWAQVKRLSVMLGLVLLATLAIDLVRIARYSFGADSLDARAAVIARQGLPRGAGAGDEARMLNERLSRLRGPGRGFSGTAAAVYRIVEAVPDSEVTGIDFQPNGALKVSLSLAGEGQANDVKSRLEAAGFSVTASVFQQSGGRVTGDMTVAP